MRRRLQRGGMRSGRRNIKSMYVDYGFPEVGDIRRERYLENFYTTEAMRDQANKLRSLPQDDPLRMQVLGATDQVLNEISKRGDYENMTTAVSRANTEYNKLATPLTTNLSNYDEYKERLQKDYDEGRLNFRDFSRTMKMANDTYTGLQMDEAGNASNYFQGVDPVYDPNIPELMYKALDGLVPDAQVVKGSKPELSGDGSKYAIQTTDGIKYVDAARVNAIMDMVMNEPAVVSYLQRGALLDSYDMDDDTARAYLMEDIKSTQEDIDKLDGLIAQEKNASNKEQLIAARNSLAAGFSELVRAHDGKEPLTAVQQQMVRKENARYRRGAEEKYTYEQTETERSYTYNELWKAKQLAKINNTNKPGTKLSYTGEAYQFESGLGSNTYEVVNSMRELNQTIQDMEQDKNQNWESWGEDVRRQWEANYTDQLLQLDLHAQVLSQRYGVTSESDLYNNPGYQAAIKKYEDAVAKYQELATSTTVDDYGGAAYIPGASSPQQNPSEFAMGQIAQAERELENWLEANSMVDPEGQVRTHAPTFHTASSLFEPDQAEATEKWIKTNWSSPPNLMAFTDKVYERATIPELLGQGNWKLSGDIGISRWLPGLNDKGIELAYVEETSGQRKTVRVPLNQVGIDAAELGMAYTPFDEFMQWVESGRYANLREYPIPVTRADGLQGKAIIRYTEDRKTDKVVFMWEDGTTSGEQLYMSDKTQDSFNSGRCSVVKVRG